MVRFVEVLSVLHFNLLERSASWWLNEPSGSGYRSPFRDLPGGAVVKNPPANAGDTDSIPGPGRSHMPRSN